ncbi:MAG TPA: AraC family transcriptional regulator [Acidiferrobacterales bacterium]
MEWFPDLLPRLRVREAQYTRVEAGAPWGLDFGIYRHTKFGLVTEGGCYVDIKDGHAPVALARGSCYLLPRGDAFRLRHAPDGDAEAFADALKRLEGRTLRCDGGGERATVVGGRFVFAGQDYPPVLDLLPPLVHFRVSERELDALEATVRLLADEIASPSLGSALMVDRLADIFFIQSLRAYLLSEQGRDVGWIGAVADERLSAAIRLMHAESARPWTLASLAARAGMSRAVFAARFKEKVGMSPMSYLTRCRFHQALQLLQQTTMSIAHVAARVGYESEAAFSKAFKREMGVPPGAYRKAERR